VANRDMKKCSASLIIKEIKMTNISHVKMAVRKKMKKLVLAKLWRKGNSVHCSSVN
jgi:hypothetical protein